MDFDYMLAEAMENVLIHIEHCAVCDKAMDVDKCPDLHHVIKDAWDSTEIMATLQFNEEPDA